MSRPIAILYEHPDWFKPLFAALERRGADYVRLDATALRWDPTARDSGYSLVVNRMSPSAWTRGHDDAIFATLQYLAHLDDIGADVLNGIDAYRVELSKAAQVGLFTELGVPHPRTRVVTDPALAPEAAEDLAWPILVKPNIGGSGAGITSFATPRELADAVPSLAPGLDGTLLLQEHLPARGEAVVRLEIVDGQLLYAIRLDLEPGTFNLCPADYCRVPDGRDHGVSGRGLPVTPVDPPAAVVEDARRIVAAAGAEVGGVEYLVDDRTGDPTFYDVNALSNFVADADDILGFDPYDDLAELIVRRAATPAEAAA